MTSVRIALALSSVVLLACTEGESIKPAHSTGTSTSATTGAGGSGAGGRSPRIETGGGGVGDGVSPIVVITSPDDGNTYKAVENVTLAGSATDPQDGPITDMISLRWSAEGYSDPLGFGETMTFNFVQTGKTKVVLTATDKDDNKGTASVTINVK
jgi:hypothetical protein